MSKKGDSRLIFLALLISVSFAGCVRRQGRNSDCKWAEVPGEKLLQANQRVYEGHLRGDLDLAEELAIEYMDAHHGPRSGNFKSQKTATESLNGCLSALAKQIGSVHDIPPKELVKFFGRRSVTLDIAACLPFLLLYCVFAATLSGRLRRRYPLEDGWTAPLIMFTLCSLAFGVGGMLLGEQWSILVESVRVGTGHLSYRVDRLPWARHHFGFFLLCLALFWASAAARYKMNQRERP